MQLHVFLHAKSVMFCLPLQEQCQTLTSQLQDAKAKLAAEKEVSKNTKRRAEFLDGELQQLRMQLETLSLSYDQAQQRNSKQEVK